MRAGGAQPDLDPGRRQPHAARPLHAVTTIGSGVWNVIFVGGGYALGTRWQRRGEVQQLVQLRDLRVLRRRHHQLGDQEGAQTAARARELVESANARRSVAGSEARADPGELPVRLGDATAVRDHAAAGAAAVPVDRPEGQPGQAAATRRSRGSGSRSPCWSAPSGRTGRSCRRCPCARTPARRSSRRST